MKAFTVVSLVCFLGAASAGLTSPAVKLENTLDECKEQAYLESLNCIRFGYQNGTGKLDCLAGIVIEYITCVEDSEPTLNEELLPLGATKQLKIDFKCIFNNLVDTAKCIVNDASSRILKISWAGIIKCIMTNVPALLTCFPQNP